MLTKLLTKWVFIKKKELPVIGNPLIFLGTDGETRTLKGINPGDFESPASTNSATSARFLTTYINFAFPIIRENRVAVKCRVL